MSHIAVALTSEIDFSPDAPERIRCLRPAFEELAKVHEEYDNNEPKEEISFWHGEMPQVGLLAAALWRCGFTALQEYGVGKEGKGERGRGDFYFRTSKDTGFECEAKHRDVNLFSDWLLDDILKDLECAQDEAMELLDRDNHFLGLSFVVPWIDADNSGFLAQNVKRLTEEWKKCVADSDSHAAVWVQASQPIKRELKRDGHNSEWRLYPGLLLIVKEVR